MLRRFFPSGHYTSIFDIDYKALREAGYSGLMFDIDNTLVPFDMPSPTKEVEALFQKLKDLGFKICLVSNNTSTRVLKFNENLKVFAVSNALKPMRRNLRKAMALMETGIHETVFIGDQLFTDMWGGNRLGLLTLLVMPIAEKEQLITKIKRSTEKKVFNIYLKTMKKKD